MIMRKRLECLDVLKGISIILVVIGHLNTSDFTHNLIYNVHLFAFVFVSGVLYKSRDKLSMFVKKDMIKIWLMFLFFSSVWIVFNYIYGFMLFNLKDGEPIEDLWSYIINSLLALLYGNANLTGESFGAIWYLAMLLSLRVFYFVADRYFKSSRFLIAAICILVSITGLFILNGHSKSPYYIFSSMSALLVFYLGTLLKDRLEYLENIGPRKLLTITILSGGGYLTLSVISGTVNLGSNTFTTPIMVYPNIVLGITFLLCISILIAQIDLIKKLLVYLGRNSLSIMGWHSEIRICMLFILSIIGIDSTLVRNIIIVISTLIICIPLNSFTNRLITAIDRSDKKLGGLKND